MPKIAVHVKLKATPGNGAALAKAFLSLYDGPLDAEPGTELHVVHQSKDDPDMVVFYELYTDADAMAAHQGGEALRAVLPKLAGLVAGPPETTLLDLYGAKGVSL